ncbi:response regulator [Kineosporia succinea]|uniref:Response regulator of citrate/malate metabolism n=1 Tax=Kineosporia succinea TaxID=84632 RepID=A0ABT9PAX8_9ACTN|nr:response regulator [Kineosporia succinea]MDP9829857.1 response regulator of citrate/malate metabolism [Kineosporia succinea]
MPDHSARRTDRRISTLIADADPVVATRHAEYVSRTPGFTVTGIVNTGAELLRRTEPPDHAEHPGPGGHLTPELILLDVNLPDACGLELCRTLRARDCAVDFIVITAERDLRLVRRAASYGVVHYLLKPLHSQDLQQHLRRYAAFRRQTSAGSGPVSQRDIDSALALLRPQAPPPVSWSADGLLAGGPENGTIPRAGKVPARRTLDRVAAHLRTSTVPVSANDVAQALGISRVTARHYLEELTDRHLVSQSQRYGTAGRPKNLYRWSSP